MNNIATVNKKTFSAILLAGLALSVASPARVNADCPQTWLPGGTGTLGDVLALTSLPSGDVIAGGQFLTAGGVSARNIVRWNGSTWSPLGNGVNNIVFGLTTLPNGDVVAGGDMSSPGDRIARWNGSSWSAMGSGMDNTVRTVLSLPNGDVLAAGLFSTAGGVSAPSIARWNGTAWSSLGQGLTATAGFGYAAQVWGLTLMPNGDIVAAGTFNRADGLPANNIARWDGVQWNPMGQGLTTFLGFDNSAFARCLAVLPNGDLLVGGSFEQADGHPARNIARWDGLSWSAIGQGIDSTVYTMKTLHNGDVIAGGGFVTAGGVDAWFIARWNGSVWSPMGSTAASGFNRYVWTLTTTVTGDLVAGGLFSSLGAQAEPHVARYRSTSLPVITTQPINMNACFHGSVSFSVAASGTGALHYQWRKNSVEIDALSNPSAASATLMLSLITSLAVGPYDCIVSDECGATLSHAAALTVCMADFNCDTVVDFFDYLDFVDAFAAEDMIADFNHDSVIDFFDYLDFIDAFSTGC